MAGQTDPEAKPPRPHPPDPSASGEGGIDPARLEAYAIQANRAARCGPREKIARLPLEVRAKLDQAILDRKPPLNSYRRIHEHFGLKQRFGVSRSALQRYGRRLQWHYRMAQQRALAIEVLGQHQARDWQRFARSGGVVVVNCLLDFFFDEQLRRDPQQLKQAVSNFATAYKAWIQAEKVIAQGGKGTQSTRHEGPDRGLDAELIGRIAREVYGLDNGREERTERE